MAHQITRADVGATELVVACRRRRKRNDLARDDPTQITTLQKSLEFGGIKSTEVVPSELHCPLQPIQTVNHTQWKLARMHTRVTEWVKSINEVLAEGLPDLMHRPLFTNQKVGAKQENCVGNRLLR